ncbi:MAG: hypothetical protein K2Q26_10125 [Bdellovibrionales bacterium]|nr:hypothetical protein [Bdellovibrionales bacterium]
MSFSSMRPIYLSILVLIPFSSGLASSVTELHAVRPARCSNIFSRGKLENSMVVSFPLLEKIPPLEPIEAFLRDKDQDGKAHYFYYGWGERAPFGEKDTGVWRREPSINSRFDVFILKAEPLVPTASWNLQGQPRVAKIDELRSQYRLVSYAKFPVPRFFTLVHQTIFLMRGIQSHVTHQRYESAKVDLSTIVSSRPVVERLEDFIRSWETRDGREKHIQSLMLSTVREAFAESREGDIPLFILSLSSKLNALFPPEISGTLVDSLRSFPR